MMLVYLETNRKPTERANQKSQLENIETLLKVTNKELSKNKLSSNNY